MGGPGGGFYPGGPEGPGVGEGGGETLGEQQQNDCRDRNALQAKDEINAHPDDGSREHASVVYRDANGSVRHSPPIHGNAVGVPSAEILSWLNQNGIAIGQVIGFAHNHDEAEYGQTGDEARANRYPSGNDWDFAQYMATMGPELGQVATASPCM